MNDANPRHHTEAMRQCLATGSALPSKPSMSAVMN